MKHQNFGNRLKYILRLSMIVLSIILIACGSSINLKDSNLEEVINNNLSHATVRESTLTPLNTPTKTIAPSPTSLSKSQPPTSTSLFRICSPLGDIPVNLLSNFIVNPFQPPPEGSDNPHQGVDLAILDQDYQIAVGGESVQTVLPGEVALVIQDRFPYGNALLIETQLSQIPTDWISQIHVPTPAPTRGPHPSLTCPNTGILTELDTTNRSIYILYAHMSEKPEYTPGDGVLCGEPLGITGDSGNALNPHLHLEVRIGPSGIRFPGMAHYETRATPEEMEAYCIWRVSGLFQLLDPMLIFHGLGGTE